MCFLIKNEKDEGEGKKKEKGIYHINILVVTPTASAKLCRQ
jgi:hypothetical protein